MKSKQDDSQFAKNSDKACCLPKNDLHSEEIFDTPSFDGLMRMSHPTPEKDDILLDFLSETTLTPEDDILLRDIE